MNFIRRLGSFGSSSELKTKAKWLKEKKVLKVVLSVATDKKAAAV